MSHSLKFAKQLAQIKKPISLGFTLVELMIVLLIIGLLLGIGLPSFVTLVKGMRVSNEANAMVAAIRYARQASINRGAIVSIAPIGASTTLAEGWTIFVDPTNSRVATTAGITPLQVRNDYSDKMIFSVNGACAAATPANANMSFSRFGGCGDGTLAAMRIMVGVESEATAGTIDPKFRRAVCMSANGRVEVRRPAEAVTDANACNP
jgi:type IV fimbrial biogenesis protein FimT